MTEYDMLWNKASRLANELYKRKMKYYNRQQQQYETISTILGFLAGLACGSVMMAILL